MHGLHGMPCSEQSYIALAWHTTTLVSMCRNVHLMILILSACTHYKNFQLQMADVKTYKMHWENRHPKAPLPDVLKEE